MSIRVLHDYERAFDCVRWAIRKSSRANIVKMTDSEMKTFFTDALTKYKCCTDEALLKEYFFYVLITKRSIGARDRSDSLSYCVQNGSS